MRIDISTKIQTQKEKADHVLPAWLTNTTMSHTSTLKLLIASAGYLIKHF